MYTTLSLELPPPVGRRSAVTDQWRCSELSVERLGTSRAAVLDYRDVARELTAVTAEE